LACVRGLQQLSSTHDQRTLFRLRLPYFLERLYHGWRKRTIGYELDARLPVYTADRRASH
jgi:hypothetical protein